MHARIQGGGWGGGIRIRTEPFFRKIIFISLYTEKNSYFFAVRTNTRFTVLA